MRKLVASSLFILLVLSASFAQDGKKALNTASRALTAFNIDPTSNKPKLKEAVDAIREAQNSSDVNSTVKFWETKGEILNEVATQIMTVRQLGLGSMDELPVVDNPAFEAFEAYNKAFSMAEKKFEKKDALKGLQNLQTILYSLGIYDYEDEKYEKAFQSFNAVIETHDLLKANGEASSLDDPTAFQDQLFVTGLAALNAGYKDKALPIFEKLYQTGEAKAAVYEALYTLKSETDREAAYKYLDEGRKKYPDEVSLLFAEINHFLALNQLDNLIGKLKTAIEKEPDNISLYTTLGNVYDNLYQKESEGGNAAKATEYFNNALDYFKQALEKDPKGFDANYSMGALYYNKAAAMTQELQKLDGDYTKEGIRKYEEKKKEIFQEFDKAMPYFKKAESLDPNDANTLIALKEIFARKDDLATSNEIKKRLDVVQAGGKNDSSFFKE
ncbi:MAG TPA: hypothetical protein PKE06_01090 [Flavilitoribacter sp.]|nr:hypothetical protein [Flavilitoribacter sp.]